ncbi:MAG: hypothetical protein M1833_004869 [Piccolia ochrophora]|nr:MAG: hypothetical protein M1833_004869 [Piccolia ochrophora]
MKKNRPTVSTAGIFKNRRQYNPRPPHRRSKSHSRPAGKAAFAATKRALSGQIEEIPGPYTPKKSSAKTKKASHPLARTYSEKLSATQAHLLESSASSLAQTCEALTAHLSAVKASAAMYTATTAVQQRALSTPLENETVRLTIASSASQQTRQEIVRIGDRVQGFRACVEKRSRLQRELCEEWQQVRREIMALSREVLGDDGVVAVDDLNREGIVLVEGKSKDDGGSEHRAKFAALRVDIKAASEDFVKQARAAEKEMDAEQRERQRKLVGFLTEAEL